MTAEQKKQLEDVVNTKIRECTPVNVREYDSGDSILSQVTEKILFIITKDCVVVA